MNEVELIEKTALRVGMKSLMNHGAASCVYSDGCNGVSQEHLIAFAREIALHCVAALASGQAEALLVTEDAFVIESLIAAGHVPALTVGNARRIFRKFHGITPASGEGDGNV